MAGTTQIITPEKVRQVQITLYRKAKAQPRYRFWSLYGELLRLDVLESALEAQFRNDGGAGVDGESLASVKSKRQWWLEQLREELRTKRYRPSPVRRVMIPKRSGGERPLGSPELLSGSPQPSPRPSLRLCALSKCPPFPLCTL